MRKSCGQWVRATLPATAPPPPPVPPLCAAPDLPLGVILGARYTFPELQDGGSATQWHHKDFGGVLCEFVVNRLWNTLGAVQNVAGVAEHPFVVHETPTPTHADQAQGTAIHHSTRCDNLVLFWTGRCLHKGIHETTTAQLGCSPAVFLADGSQIATAPHVAFE